MQLAMEPTLLKNRLDVITKGGVVGERNVTSMYFCALDSRLLPANNKSPNTLAVKNAGHFGSGKSYTLMSVLEIYPKSRYHLITNGSPKSIYHIEGGLKHKALVVTEGFQFQEKNAADSELVYVVRSLISEGQITYQFVEKDETGKLKTVMKTIEGPTSFITTTVMEKLEGQLEDRLFTIHPDESVQQTKEIIRITAEMISGRVSGLDTKIIRLWKAFHELLVPVQVIVPFAAKIAAFVTASPGVPISARRAFNRVLAVTQTIGCTYQYQRTKDSKGRVVAEIPDYYMALQIVREAFKESVGQQSKGNQDRLAFVREKGVVSYRDMEKEWGISKSGVSQWANSRVRDGILVWCDESGAPITDANEIKKAKSAGKAFMTLSEADAPSESIGLPSPFDLTRDAAWKENGDLWRKFDLDLDSRQGVKVSSGVKEVFSGGLNTQGDGEPIDMSGNSEDAPEGIKVFSPDLALSDQNEEAQEPAATKRQVDLFRDGLEGVDVL
jgi:DNA primase